MHENTPERLSPLESSKERPRFHEIALKSKEDSVVAHARLQYRNDVAPSYYVDFLEVVDALQNKGIGQQLLKEINTFLQEKRVLDFCTFLKILQKQSTYIRKWDGTTSKTLILCFSMFQNILPMKIKVRSLPN